MALHAPVLPQLADGAISPENISEAEGIKVILPLEDFAIDDIVRLYWNNVFITLFIINEEDEFPDYFLVPAGASHSGNNVVHYTVTDAGGRSSSSDPLSLIIGVTPWLSTMY